MNPAAELLYGAPDGGHVPAMLIDWLERARAGDEAALNQLLKALGPIIRRRARRYLAVRLELRRGYGSDDFQQLSLIHLAEQIRNGHVRAHSCDEFLRLVTRVVQQQISRVARGELADRRDMRRTVSLEAGSEPASGGYQDPEQFAVTKELFAVAWQYLTPEEKQIAELYLQDTPWHTIAAQLGQREAAVKHRWRSALSRIRRQLAPPGEHPPTTPNVMTAIPTDLPDVRR